MPESISDDELAIALETLSDWHREGPDLVRDVSIAGEARERLEEAVMTVADELDHYPRIDQTPLGARFRLGDRATGVGVLDVETASRIDEVIETLPGQDTV